MPVYTKLRKGHVLESVVQHSGHFYVRRFRTLQSGALISGDGATHSPLSLAMVQYFPAVLDFPYCQSFARFFCSMV